MGEAILKGVLASGLALPGDIIVSDLAKSRRQYLSERYGVKTTADNLEAVKQAQTIVLAVKPQVLKKAITGELVELIRQDALIISIIGSVELSQLEELLPHKAVVRVMPNTPLAVGAGMTAIAGGKQATAQMIEETKSIFASCGEVIEVEESQLEAITAVSGCGPGYVFVLIDALADAGVNAGLPRELAVRLAAQTFAGAGKMVVETSLPPAVLRDQVTSPGGTTIAGLHALENRGVRVAMYDAVQAVLARSEKLKGK
ncbi:MAG TPA: pyrroline-5-carboxylate reductase [Candidatus Avacidaminococcus intestinavium]|uniref:Pyrroline-5-carboxylate reductase n=1 Tax=Candidatus Avacidaminococcus intestinavium TaxID=2840684 RepID=A0A9D1SKZ6_9FIRM|nr:pyrroline-5-carboxylate reductase [Candidatus Avacidaminococcus intestinavium]